MSVAEEFSRHERFEDAYPVRIEHAEHPSGRLIALSDIHGCADLFYAMLDTLRLGEGDLLVIVGDLVERRSGSLRVVRRAMELAESGCAKVLMGNADCHIAWQLWTDRPENPELLMRNIRRYGNSLFAEMCAELGLPCSCEDEIRAAKEPVRMRFEREIRFLAERPTILETPAWRFVHGGMRSLTPEEGENAFPYLKFDMAALYCPVMDKPTVVGHSPVDLYDTTDEPVHTAPRWHADKNMLTIDGGCGLRAEQQLNAVFLREDGTYTWIGEDGLPKVRALDRQESRAPSCRFRWPDSDAEILRIEGGFARLRSPCSGAECVIPARYCDDFRVGKTRVNDFSDALLDVYPGDTLSVADELPGGTVYAKKDGISGIYTGRLERI